MVGVTTGEGSMGEETTVEVLTVEETMVAIAQVPLRMILVVMTAEVAYFRYLRLNHKIRHLHRVVRLAHALRPEEQPAFPGMHHRGRRSMHFVSMM